MTIDEFITNALYEDIGEADHTSVACIPENSSGKARLLIKETGILAGVSLAQKIFHKVGPEIKLEVFYKDGAKVKAGTTAFTVEGKSRSILSAERLVLNCMQRMSGIATLTRQLVSCLKGTGVTLLDTRKTTPNFRLAEKMAVKIGGGENHRFCLDEMIMIKDNHIDVAGGITQSIKAAGRYLKENGKVMKIAVEARNLREVKEILKTGGIDRIMLDNFTPAGLQKAVKLINGQYETEATGGINENNIRQYAITGVDYISSGAITHSAKALDMCLEMDVLS